MNVSYNWLKDYIDCPWTHQEIIHRLTSCGLKVEGVKEDSQNRDVILNIEITTNRPDCLSIIGIAREIGALLGKTIKDPVKDALLKWQNVDTDRSRPIHVDIVSKQACYRYTGQLIKDVKIQPSPDWLIKRLVSVGLNPINNVVDITNFVLMETGQPLHAFDASRIQGSSVIVRFAKDTEVIKTLDGVERKLMSSCVIIADKEKPIALAGIMGGIGSEVGWETRDIFLESAMFNPILIRKTARALGISTDSSYRFERGIDPEGVLAGLKRAVLLISEIAGGKIIGRVVNKGKKPSSHKKILFDCKWSAEFLGKNIRMPVVKKIFTGLGFGVKTANKDKLRVSIPPRRSDIRIAQDLCEEVGRIIGYDNFTSKVPLPDFSVEKIDEEHTFLKTIRQYLASIGLYEAYTYSLLSNEVIKNSCIDKNIIIPVLNPLSSQQEALRPRLAPGLMQTISKNFKKGIEYVCMFEIGHCYTKQGGCLNETKNLCIAIAGKTQRNWKDKQRELDIFDLKKILFSVFDHLNVKNIAISTLEDPMLDEQMSFAIQNNGKTIGYLGRIKNSISEAFQINIGVSGPSLQGLGVYIAELSLNAIKECVKSKMVFSELPKFPSVIRDISFFVDNNTNVSGIMDSIMKTEGGIIEDVLVFDEYREKNIEQDKRSIGLSIVYRSKDGTLTDQEVDNIHTKIRDILVENFRIQIR
jgi:phenylalanyl-tRNA synthetase beta chain